jgi:hypothetical protein
MDEPEDGPRLPRHPKPAKEDRAAELAAQLRKNLRRRKEQARAREATPEPPERPRRS